MERLGHVPRDGVGPSWGFLESRGGIAVSGVVGKEVLRSWEWDGCESMAVWPPPTFLVFESVKTLNMGTGFDLLSLARDGVILTLQVLGDNALD